MESQYNGGLLNKLKIKDWRILLGLVLTVGWLVGWLATAFFSGWTTFWNEKLASLGGLEGLFAPMAFLWLVIGLFIQQKEISLNTQVLEKSNRQAEEQTKVLEATELRTRQTAFFQTADRVFQATGTLLGFIISTSLGPKGNGFFKEKEIEEMWVAHGAGYHDRFPLVLLADELVTEELFFGTATKRMWSEDIIRNIRKVQKLAAECDDDQGTISKAIMQCSLGYVYMQLLPHLRAPSAWAMFEEDPLLGTNRTEVNVTGHWDSVSIEGNEKFIVNLEQHADNSVTGTLGTADGMTDVHYGIIDGNRLFLSFIMQGNPAVATTTIEGDEFHGTVQWREGLLLSFRGSRTSSDPQARLSTPQTEAITQH